MSGRANVGAENSSCAGRLALGYEASKALLFNVVGPDHKAVYALIPNGEADSGSVIEPIWELVKPQSLCLTNILNLQ
jgi:hypothetical protein